MDKTEKHLLDGFKLSLTIRNPLIKHLVIISEEEFFGLVYSFLEEIDIEVFTWAEKLSNYNKSRYILEYSQAIRLNRHEITKSVICNYSDAIHKMASAFTSPASVRGHEKPTLSLVSNDKMEEELAEKRAYSETIRICTFEINQLRSRIEAVQPGLSDLVSPLHCVRSLIEGISKHIIRDMEYSNFIVFLLKSFERKLKHAWPSVIKKQNEYLKSKGINIKAPSVNSHTNEPGLIRKDEKIHELLDQLSILPSKPLNIQILLDIQQLESPKHNKLGLPLIKVIDNIFSRSFSDARANSLTQLLVLSLQIPTIKYALAHQDFIDDSNNELRAILSFAIELSLDIDGSIYAKDLELLLEELRNSLTNMEALADIRLKLESIRKKHEKHRAIIEQRLVSSAVAEDRLNKVTSWCKQYTNFHFNNINGHPTFLIDFIKSEWLFVTRNTILKYGTKGKEWRNVDEITLKLKQLTKDCYTKELIATNQEVDSLINSIQQKVNDFQIEKNRVPEFVYLLKAYIKTKCATNKNEVAGDKNESINVHKKEISENNNPFLFNNASLKVEEIDFKDIKLTHRANTQTQVLIAEDEKATEVQLALISAFTIGSEFLYYEGENKTKVKLSLFLKTRKIYLFTDNIGRKHMELSTINFAGLIERKLLIPTYLSPLFESSLELVIKQMRSAS